MSNAGQELNFETLNFARNLSILILISHHWSNQPISKEIKIKEIGQ